MKRRAETIATTAAAVGLLAAVGVGLETTDHRDNEGLIRDRVTAVRTVDSVLGNLVVLKAGAQYRTAPYIAPEAGLDGPTTLAGSVPAGKELVINLGLQSSPPESGTADQSGWIGFTLPGTDTAKVKSLEDRAKVTVWADVGALTAQGEAFTYDGTGTAANTARFIPAYVKGDGSINLEEAANFMNSGVNSQGQGVIFTAPADHDNLNAASSFIEPAGDFEASIVKPQ